MVRQPPRKGRLLVSKCECRCYTHGKERDCTPWKRRGMVHARREALATLRADGEEGVRIRDMWWGETGWCGGGVCAGIRPRVVSRSRNDSSRAWTKWRATRWAGGAQSAPRSRGLSIARPFSLLFHAPLRVIVVLLYTWSPESGTAAWAVSDAGWAMFERRQKQAWRRRSGKSALSFR